MARKTDYESEIESEIEHDAAAHGGKRPKRKAGGSTTGHTGSHRADRHSRRQAGGGMPLPMAAGNRAIPVRPGIGGVAAGTPRAVPGAVMPTRVMPRPVGVAAPAVMGAGALPRGFASGGRAGGNRWGEKWIPGLGDEKTDDVNKSRGDPKLESEMTRTETGYAKRAAGGSSDFKPGGEKGKLHRELGIPESEKIGSKRIAKAEHSDNPEIRRDAVRAETMSKWKK